MVVGAPPAGAAVTTTNHAGTLATALSGPGAHVTGASFTEVPGVGTPHAVATSDLAGLPTHDGSFAVLTTGNAAFADDANTAPNTGQDLGDTSPRGASVRDASVLRVDLAVPSTANCLSFDFKFLSEEYPEYVGSQFNDAFIAELDASSWSASGSAISSPDNFAFDQNGNVVSVNAVGLGGFSPGNAAGTTYDGATPLLSAAAQVTPGDHSLYLSVFDMGDGVFDSAAFVDNLRVGWVPDPATQCQPGAQVKQFQLDLAPAAATSETGSSHTVTATLRDLNASPQHLAGGTILFETSGAHTQDGVAVTGAAGEATFTYTGTAVGVDTINACYDHDTSGSCDADEPFGSAQVTWTNAPPSHEPGGPYSGDEGSDVTLDGSAEDLNGDTLTHEWTVAPASGVDAGAACVVADPSALETTVNCTDDGVWELTLSTDDGVNDPVTDTTELSIGNLAPVVESITVPTEPVAVGTPVQVVGEYTDQGGNDTHTAAVDWGDGAGTTPPASTGSVSGEHAYTGAGTYSVCLEVTDDDGASDVRCSADQVVVYDPAAGFVTGGGWVRVPPGSYAVDPSVAGAGRFGFVSRYQHGASVPHGSTEFQLRAGDLDFHATSLEWLVVDGAKALYRGVGRLNGERGFEFLVFAVDGGRPGGGGDDRFRIRIWDPDTGDLVLDNQAGAGDDAAATPVISRGSIVIHD